MMKKLAVALGLVIVIAAIVLSSVLDNLDGIVQSAIESIGSKALGVDVSVGSVSLDLKQGRGSLGDFAIANPEGFSSEPAFAVGKLTLELDSTSVQLISAAEPRIQVEVQGETNNFEQLLAGLQTSEPDATNEATETPAEPVSLTIERIEIAAARATVKSDQATEDVVIDIPLLQFSNVSGTGEEIANQILEQLLSDIVAAIKAALAESVEEAIEAKVEEAKEGLADRLREKISGERSDTN